MSTAAQPVDGAARATAPRGPGRVVRAWNVLHAAESAGALLPLATAQRDAGMRPLLVTPARFGRIEDFAGDGAGEAAASASLVSTWQRVRQWRKALLDCDPGRAADLVHAHGFPAGMAGVRNCPCVVYDVRDFVEAGAEPGQQWLARSLRVAEQFVLARAAAVVIHRESLLPAVRERGADEGSVFVVPDALAPPRAVVPDRQWLRSLGAGERHVVFFASEVEPPALDVLLAAFAQVLTEVEHATLLLPAADPASAPLRAKIAAAGVSRAVRCVPPGVAPRLAENADVVVAGACEESPNPAALAAMSAGRAVLAADLPFNRDLSSEGRGCLWYEQGNARDLAVRAAFLARNAEFRRALGESGRALLRETRSPEAVARRYDEVYRYAFARRRSDTNSLIGQFQPAQAML